MGLLELADGGDLIYFCSAGGDSPHLLLEPVALRLGARLPKPSRGTAVGAAEGNLLVDPVNLCRKEKVLASLRVSTTSAIRWNRFGGRRVNRGPTIFPDRDD